MEGRKIYIISIFLNNSTNDIMSVIIVIKNEFIPFLAKKNQYSFWMFGSNNQI